MMRVYFLTFSLIYFIPSFSYEIRFFLVSRRFKTACFRIIFHLSVFKNKNVNITSLCNVDNITFLCNIDNITPLCNIDIITFLCNIDDITSLGNIDNITSLGNIDIITSLCSIDNITS